MHAEAAGNEMRGAHTDATDLALVGEISLLLDSARDLTSLDPALQRLCEFTRADAGDLFLAHPDGSETYLVSHVGDDVEAFGQQQRFRVGEGLPGIVLTTAAPVWTRHLPDEIDFVRSRVVVRGYSSAICVPLVAGGTAEGCVLLAWRESKRDLRRTVHTVALAGRALATSVELIRTRLLAEARTSAVEASGQDVVTERMKARIPADSIRLIPAGGRTDDGGPISCPVCADGSVQILGGRAGWPEVCVREGCTGKARYCVGVNSGAAGWAVATLLFREQVPVPLTRHVPAALWLANSEGGQPSDGVGPGGAPGAGRSHARLEIRCMGRFEVLVDGHPVSHQRFGRSKAIELLALLAWSPRPVSMEELECSLWPHADASRTRNRLHVTLSALRAAVEDRGDPASVHIQRDGRFYVLDRHSSVDVDLWRFRELLNVAAASLRGRAASVETVIRLQEAIALHEGDLFGGAFAGDWAQGAAQRIRAQIRWASERLEEIDAARSRGAGSHPGPAGAP